MECMDGLSNDGELGVVGTYQGGYCRSTGMARHAKLQMLSLGVPLVRQEKKRLL